MLVVLDLQAGMIGRSDPVEYTERDRIFWLRRIVSRFLLTLCAVCGAGAAATTAGSNELLADYRYLHQNPELSLQERNTAAYLSEKLEATGFEVTTGVGGYGLVAILRNGDGPVILFRADMDALPFEEQTGLPFRSRARSVNTAGEEVPVMHACGHDAHMTVLLGIARRIAAASAAALRPVDKNCFGSDAPSYLTRTGTTSLSRAISDSDGDSQSSSGYAMPY